MESSDGLGLGLIEYMYPDETPSWDHKGDSHPLNQYVKLSGSSDVEFAHYSPLEMILEQEHS